MFNLSIVSFERIIINIKSMNQIDKLLLLSNRAKRVSIMQRDKVLNHIKEYIENYQSISESFSISEKFSFSSQDKCSISS